MKKYITEGNVMALQHKNNALNVKFKDDFPMANEYEKVTSGKVFLRGTDYSSRQDSFSVTCRIDEDKWIALAKKLDFASLMEKDFKWEETKCFNPDGSGFAKGSRIQISHSFNSKYGKWQWGLNLADISGPVKENKDGTRNIMKPKVVQYVFISLSDDEILALTKRIDEARNDSRNADSKKVFLEKCRDEETWRLERFKAIRNARKAKGVIIDFNDNSIHLKTGTVIPFSEYFIKDSIPIDEPVIMYLGRKEEGKNISYELLMIE